MLPEWFYLSVVVAFGLVIGSFLNVVIYRFHTGRSLNDRSHCLSCGKPLAWYELLPVVSYVVLRGRCRGCGSFIPYRYALVELLTAGLFVLAYIKFDDLVLLSLSFVLLSILVIGLVYDLYHMIIPDEVSYGAFILSVLMVGWGIAGGGSWQLFTSALLGALASFLVYASLWYFSNGRAFGFGDAKLAVSLGTLVGLSGVLSLIILSFWIGALVSLFIMAAQAVILNIGRHSATPRRVNMKSEIPFAPFLIASFVLVYFADADVLAVVSGFIERLWL